MNNKYLYILEFVLTKKYSLFSLIKEGLGHNLGWEKAWRDPEPNNEYKVVIVDSLKHMASVRYVPGGINYYPTIVLFENGYLKEELTMNQIITKTQE